MATEQLSIALTFLVMLIAIIYGFLSSMRKVETEKGREYADMLYGVWVEILVTFFPFLIYVLVGAFKDDVAHVLQTPELAVAAAVLSGQAVLKLLHGAIGIPTLREARERIVFLAMLGLLVFLLSVATIVLIASADQHPWFVGPVQLLLLALALPLYSALAGAALLLRGQESNDEGSLAPKTTG
jgi:heme/copper-type cytochrome/quinol oxidase subunit 2